MKFDCLFRKIRKQADLTQMEMSRELRISQAALSKIEHGQVDPSAQALLRLVRFTAALTDPRPFETWGRFYTVHTSCRIRKERIR